MEAVYQSPHFDLKSQKILDPVHLEELIKEIEFNHKLPKVEKAVTILAL
jgi:hypothetical protein